MVEPRGRGVLVGNTPLVPASDRLMLSYIIRYQIISLFVFPSFCEMRLFLYWSAFFSFFLGSIMRIMYYIFYKNRKDCKIFRENELESKRKWKSKRVNSYYRFFHLIKSFFFFIDKVRSQPHRFQIEARDTKDQIPTIWLNLKNKFIFLLVALLRWASNFTFCFWH